jgi:hypothetical protein
MLSGKRLFMLTFPYKYKVPIILCIQTGDQLEGKKLKAAVVM